MLSRPYIPDEDSLLLLECVEKDIISLPDNKKEISVLEVACGIGFISSNLISMGSIARHRIARLVCSDISMEAVKEASERLAGSSVTEVLVGDLAEHFRDGAFDIVLFNPPYLPIGEDDLSIAEDRTIFGRERGSEVTLSMLRSSLPTLKPYGHVLFMTSSLTVDAVLDEISTISGLKLYGAVCEKRLFFETLYVIKAVKLNL